MRYWIQLTPVVLAVVLLSAGCGQHTPPPSPTPDAAQSDPSTNGVNVSAPADEAPALPTANTDAAAAPASAPPNLTELTLDLHRWIGAKQRLPKDWEEYAANATKPIPPPPAGKKYSISPRWTVILVNR